MRSAHYNPATLHLDPGVTAYEEFHEWAHLDQHARRTLLWILWEWCRAVPVACRLAVLGVEIEAALLARQGMKACGIWWPEDGREARRALLSYVRDLTVF